MCVFAGRFLLTDTLACSVLRGVTNARPLPSLGTHAFEVVVSFLDNAIMTVEMAALGEWTLVWFGHRVTHTPGGGLVLLHSSDTLPLVIQYEFLSFSRCGSILCACSLVIAAEPSAPSHPPLMSKEHPPQLLFHCHATWGGNLAILRKRKMW